MLDATSNGILSEYLTIGQLAVELGVSSKTLDKMRINGFGPKPIKLGRNTLYNKVAVEEWLRGKTAAPGIEENCGTPASAVEMPPLLSEYLTDRELAVQLGRSHRTIARWRRLREGPPVTRVGRRVLYRRSAVAEWLEAGGYDL